MSELLIVTDPFVVDEHVFLGWVQGVEGVQGIEAEQYQTYHALQSCLREPFHALLPVQIPHHTITWMVRQYFGLDQTLLRIVAGKRIGHKLLKQANSLAQQSSLREQSALRQLYNLRRVYKTFVEQADNDVDPVQGLEQQFFLEPDAAQQYVRIMFLAKWKVDVQRKRLQYLSLEDIELFASVLMRFWGRERDSESGTKSLELDTGLLEGFKEFKPILFGYRLQDQFKTILTRRLAGMKPAPKLIAFLRSLCAIGLKLSKSMEIRSLASLCHEELVGWMGRCSYTSEEWTMFYTELSDIPVTLIRPMRVSDVAWKCFIQHWAAFIQAVGSIGIAMHHRSTLAQSTRRWF